MRIILLLNTKLYIFLHTQIHDNILITPATSRSPRKVCLCSRRPHRIQEIHYIKLYAAVQNTPFWDLSVYFHADSSIKCNRTSTPNDKLNINIKDKLQYGILTHYWPTKSFVYKLSVYLHSTWNCFNCGLRQLTSWRAYDGIDSNNVKLWSALQQFPCNYSQFSKRTHLHFSFKNSSFWAHISNSM